MKKIHIVLFFKNGYFPRWTLSQQKPCFIFHLLIADVNNEEMRQEMKLLSPEFIAAVNVRIKLLT